MSWVLRAAHRSARVGGGRAWLASMLILAIALAGCGSFSEGAWPVRVEARLASPGALVPLASGHVVEVQVFVVHDDGLVPVAFGASGRPQDEGGETVLLFTAAEPTRTVWLPDGVYDVEAVAKDGYGIATHAAEDLGVVIGPRGDNRVVLEMEPLDER